MHTGTWSPAARSRVRTSSPSRSGMLRSSRTTAGLTRVAASRAARPPEAGTTAKPSSSSPAATARRIAGSSSTRRTTGPAAGGSATPHVLAVACDAVAGVGDDDVAPGPAADLVDLAVTHVDDVVAG